MDWKYPFIPQTIVIVIKLPVKPKMNVDNAGTLVGWGRNGWGEEPYGDSFNKLVQPAGVSATSSVGSSFFSSLLSSSRPRSI